MRGNLHFSIIVTTMTIFLNFSALANEKYTHTFTTDQGAINIGGGKVTINNGEMTSTPGAPQLGFRIMKLALPPNTVVSGLSVENSNPILLGTGSIDFARGDIRTGDYPPDTASFPDQSIYGSDDIYPQIRAEILNSGYWGNIHLIDLAIYPIGYKPVSERILLFGEITVHIDLETGPNTSGTATRSDPHAYDAVSEKVDNKSDLPLFATPPSIDNPPMLLDNIPAPEYLIITSGAIAPGFYPFLMWKNQKGVPTDMVMIEDILGQTSGQDPAEQLRNFLIQAYNDGVQYILLGGDEDVIPIRYLYPGNVSNYYPELRVQQLSDLYYADLTGEWDVDGDGVWGESYHDNPDIYPELYVGRVPARTEEHASIWGNKAIIYEKNPGLGDPSYLTKALFICADQMRDYGQHEVLAGMIPDNFLVDASRLIEEPSGGDWLPTQPTGDEVINVMQEGWGFISNLNHGSYEWYSSRSEGYNVRGYKGVWGDTIAWYGCGAISHLTTYDQPAIHYSISCMLAALDFDKGIFWPGPYITTYCFAESYLFQPGGGVAFLGNTRFGWVSPSFNLERKFVEYVFQDSTSTLSLAEALSKIDYPNYRQIGYGHNLFGDPEMSLWLSVDGTLLINGPSEIELGHPHQLHYEVFVDDDPIQGARVCLYMPGEIFETAITDESGSVTFHINPQSDGHMTVTATKQRYIPAQNAIVVGSPLGIDDEIDLPRKPLVYQNYPNPFNTSTIIEFGLPERARVELDIYDIRGRLVRKLASKEFPAGDNRLAWNGKNDSFENVASGMYFFKFSVGSTTYVKQMTLLK